MSCEDALEKAIEYLIQYGADDEIAGLNGSGCYSNPNKVIDGWIKEINKLEGQANERL